VEVRRPAYAGTAWTVKNLLELKNARRVRIEGNVFEGSWVQSQIGFAIVLTVRNQDGRAPWSVVEDVIFANNVVRGATSGINILGRGPQPSQPADPTHRDPQQRVRRHRRTTLGRATAGSSRSSTARRRSSSTTTQPCTSARSLPPRDRPHRGFVFTDNIVAHNTYGITGTNAGTGSQALDALFPRGRRQAQRDRRRQLSRIPARQLRRALVGAGQVRGPGPGPAAAL
jgi:hypothetical protein